MTAKALMVLGTGSHAGKSLVTAALCRILAQDGYRVAPFKSQNMALNSAATPDGSEIGRAQAMQAEAARVAPTADMNPILLKPSSDTSSQVILQGRVWGQVSATGYFNHSVKELFPAVLESYERLARDYEIIVLEGAGSPAEINLREYEIVNMRMAEAANAACVLIGDIDRGGVFASLAGTMQLLDENERKRIRGYIINKFRGDVTLLQPAIEMMKDHLPVPCLGVIPYLAQVGLDEEDGVAIEDRRTAARVWRNDDETPARRLRVGVIALPHMSNFTDFDALAAEPSVALAYVSNAREVANAGVLIIPGSKQTLNDLAWLQAEGFADPIRQHAGLIVGVCGGMQMLGAAVHDAGGREGGGQLPGLGLLPIRTTLVEDKVTQLTTARLIAPQLFDQPMTCDTASGYEIHLGTTEYQAGARPLLTIKRSDGTTSFDGATSTDGRIIGTYLHGFFDDDEFRHSFINAARAALRLNPSAAYVNYRAEREARFDRLAAHVRQSIDLDAILNLLELTKATSARP
ncbi:MAG TPA: cobyric acid synthase [Pyrinomonadaceae bacterium]|nr:cobyric acid synthase [Pyrinomonadaceae bacterium]